MAEVYENPTLPRQGQKDAYVKDEDMSFFDRTRHTATPQPDRSPAGSARSGSQGVKRDRDALDDPNSGEWGSTMARRPSTDIHSQPSSKRVRRDSRDDNADRSDRPLQRVPTNVDDVQKRIDEIVNSSSGAGGPAPQLPRRPSNQPTNPQSSMRRPSSSASNRSGPPPSYSNGHQDRLPPQSRPDSRDNGVYNQSDQFELPKPSSRVPPAQSDARAPQPPRPESKQNGIDAIDDAEKVDYGSEEGEV